MKTSEPKIDPESVQSLVLARLLVPTKKPLSRAKVIEAVAAAIAPPLGKGAADAAALAAFVRCEQAGQLDSAPAAKGKGARGKKSVRGAASAKKTRTPPEQPAITPKGERALAALLAAGPLPAIESWEQARQLVGLSKLGRVRAPSRALQAEPLAARILAARHGVPSSIETLPAVVDYLAWRALGVDTLEPFDADAVQRHLLRELVPADVRVDQPVWRRMLAMRALDASGHDANALTRGLLSATGFVAKAGPAKRKKAVTRKARVPNRAAPPVVNDNDPRPRAQPSLADFAIAVRQAARAPSVARFHDDRAFIGSVWEHMRGRGPVGDMSLADFKQRLIAAHRERLLRITRADLVGAMDPSEVERSEARFQDATFHFVALDAGGMR